MKDGGMLDWKHGRTGGWVLLPLLQPSILLAAAPAASTSLENLFDIVVPPPVPWWPPAPGWFVASGVLLALGFWGSWRAWTRWQAAAYRRIARIELRQLKTRAADPRQREAALRRLPELVKRTALTAFNREDVASLSGRAWLRFLDRTGHTNAFTQGCGQLLPEIAYDPRVIAQMDAAVVEELFSVVRRWIDRHSTAVEAAATGN
jgi:Domain of unknown function (DUF4381)